jgi:hypothetical protein
MGANLEAGNTISAAELANMGETQQIRNYGDVTLPLNNLQLPLAQGTQNEQFTFLPQSSFLQSKLAQQAPLNFLRIAPGNPPAVQPLPTAPPDSGVGGAIAQGISGGASAALQSYLGQLQQQQQFNQQQKLMSQWQAYQNNNNNNNWNSGAVNEATGLFLSGFGAG